MTHTLRFFVGATALAGMLAPSGAALAQAGKSAQAPGNELIVPYAGGELPDEALNPQHGRVVLLMKGAEAVRAGAPANGRANAPPAPELILTWDGGELPELALNPPPGVVVKLRRP